MKRFASIRAAAPLAVLYVVVVWASYALGYDEDQIIPIWPAAGILVFAGFRFGWPGLIIFGIVDFVAAQVRLPGHEPAPVIDALLSAANVAALASAMALPGAAARVMAMFEGTRAMLWFLGIAALLASGISAALALGILHALSAFDMAPAVPLWELGLRWFLSDYVGTVVVTPLIVAWVDYRSSSAPGSSRHLAGAVVAIAAILSLTTVVPLPAGASHFSLLLGLSPLLLWAALTTSPLGLTALVAATGIGAAALTIEVIAPSSGMRADTGILVVQAYLLAAALSALVVLAAGREQVRLAMERGNLARFFSPRLVEIIAGGLDEAGRDRQQDAAVMFVDIRGFTGFAEQRDPRQVMSVLRTFTALVEKRVFEHDGTLDKYLGDGAMATFGVPAASAADARNALDCARGLLADLASLRRQHRGDELAALRVGIGVHFGPVVLGTIGSERTKSLSVLGDTVNTAARLQALTRDLDTSLAVSGDLVAAIRAEGHPDGAALLEGLASRGERQVRGRNATTELWTLDGGP